MEVTGSSRVFDCSPVRLQVKAAHLGKMEVAPAVDVETCERGGSSRWPVQRAGLRVEASPPCQAANCITRLPHNWGQDGAGGLPLGQHSMERRKGPSPLIARLSSLYRVCWSLAIIPSLSKTLVSLSESSKRPQSAEAVKPPPRRETRPFGARPTNSFPMTPNLVQSIPVSVHDDCRRQQPAPCRQCRNNPGQPRRCHLLAWSGLTAIGGVPRPYLNTTYLLCITLVTVYIPR